MKKSKQKGNKLIPFSEFVSDFIKVGYRIGRKHRLTQKEIIRLIYIAAATLPR